MKRFIFIVFLGLVQCGWGNDFSEKSPRVLVHLLDYIALDYPGAVQNGKVVEASEYKEQLEFADTLLELNQELPETNQLVDVSNDLKNLKTLILKRASSEQVAKASKDLKWKIIGITGMALAPARWPNLKHGRETFEKNCAQCHGVQGHGDGPAGNSLDPKPSNFHEAEKMSQLPPFQAYNAIRLGVPGTAMASWPTLSESEIWELAFYVSSFRHGEIIETSQTEKTGITLQQVATLSDVELLKILPGSDEAKKAHVLSELRRHSEGGNGLNSFIALARSELLLVLESYKKGIPDEARRHALAAYLNGVEPVEPNLRAYDSRLLSEIEEAMGAVRAALDRRVEITQLENVVNHAQSILDKVGVALKRESSAVTTFVVSSGIVLREAFEAILLLITLLGVIRSVGSRQAAFFVHGGWMLAVLLGFVLWFFSGWAMEISGAQREVLEGAVSLFAVGVVLYMGFWLHRKTEIGRWRSFLNEMVKSAVSAKSLFLLGSISFMAVFREVFETVLFLRAVLLEAGSGQQTVLFAGVVSSLGFVFILSFIAVRFSARIPVRQLFEVSSVIMILLSVILMGKAVHSFQEAGMLSVSEFPFRLRWEFLGIYPTYEGLIPQLIITLITLAIWKTGRQASLEPLNQS